MLDARRQNNVFWSERERIRLCPREIFAIHHEFSQYWYWFTFLVGLPSDGVKVSDFLNRVLGSGSSSAGKESSEKSQIFDISSFFRFHFSNPMLGQLDTSRLKLKKIYSFRANLEKKLNISPKVSNSQSDGTVL